MVAIVRQTGVVSEGLVLAAIFALALVPVMLTPIIPAIDLYNHVSRYDVMAHLAADPFLRANYMKLLKQ